MSRGVSTVLERGDTVANVLWCVWALGKQARKASPRAKWQEERERQGRALRGWTPTGRESCESWEWRITSVRGRRYFKREGKVNGVKRCSISRKIRIRNQAGISGAFRRAAWWNRRTRRQAVATEEWSGKEGNGVLGWSGLLGCWGGRREIAAEHRISGFAFCKWWRLPRKITRWAAGKAKFICQKRARNNRKHWRRDSNPKTRGGMTTEWEEGQLLCCKRKERREAEVEESVW